MFNSQPVESASAELNPPELDRGEEQRALRSTPEKHATLRLGDSGAEVKELQRMLNDLCSGPRLKVDGDFGGKTKAAVLDFQNSQPSLTADGVVGPKTWAAIEAAIKQRVADRREISGNPAAKKNTASDLESKAATPIANGVRSETFRFGIDQVLKWEGGLSTDPNDAGNRNGNVTNLGVTQPAYDTYRKNHQLEQQSVKSISRAEVLGLYHEQYYQVAKCDLLAGERPATDRERGQSQFAQFNLRNLAVFQLDTAVNMGPKAAACILQEALNRSGAGIGVDGKIGPATLAALQATSEREILPAVFEVREELYRKIARQNPRNERYLNGWLNRLEDLRDTLTPRPLLSMRAFTGGPSTSTSGAIKDFQEQNGLSPSGEIDSETFERLMHPEQNMFAGRTLQP